MRPPKKQTFDPVPKGSHVARLYQIVHIGTVSFTWQGKESTADKMRLTFELCDEKKVFKEGEEPRPFSISREFSYSMSPRSKLRPFIEGMLGTALHDDEAYSFDPEKLLGEACLLNVVHEEKNGTVYANIANASPVPKSMEAAVPALFNEKKLVDVETSDRADIDALPDFLRDKMYSSIEFANRFGGNGQSDGSGVTRDDTPF